MTWLKQNWFKRHPIASVFLSVVLLGTMVNAFNDEDQGGQRANVYKPTHSILPTLIITPILYKTPEKQCHPSYSGCLNLNASDYDCAGGSGNGPYYTGTVRVLGPDVFDLDRDNDGWGCE